MRQTARVATLEMLLQCNVPGASLQEANGSRDCAPDGSPMTGCIRGPRWWFFALSLR
jgi:hypothetical protein